MTTTFFRDIFHRTHLESSLCFPPFGFIIRFPPLRPWFVCAAPSPSNSNFCHGPNIPYPVYTPVLGMPGCYRLVHNAIIRNLESGEMPGRISDLSSFFRERLNHPVGLESIRISVFVEPLSELNLPPIGYDHFSLVPAAEVTTNEETLDSELNNLPSDSDLTYEQYLELEERMGRVGSRLSEEKIMQHIRITSYTTTTTSTNEGPDICVICQGEYGNDEFMGGLRCGHEYHVQCIKKWLQQINNCPICKATAVS